MDITDQIANLHAENTELRRQVAALEAQAEDFQSRIGRLESRLEEDVDRAARFPTRAESKGSGAENGTYTLNETAFILEVDYKIVYNLVRKGELGSLRIGGQYKIPQVELEAYMTRTSADLTEGRRWELVDDPGQELPRAMVREHYDNNATMS